jgi:hypothetical protein
MSDNLLDKVKANSMFPDDLMAEISRSTLGRTVVISIVVHVLVLGVTSIGFIGLCLKYDTLHPKQAMLAEVKAQKKAAAEAADKPAPAAGGAATQPVPAAGSTATTTPAATATTPTADGKTPIEQTLEEVDRNLPKKSNVTFDKVDSLE